MTSIVAEGSLPTVIALIPARSGSTRVPDKNVRLLADHPLLAYTISAALESRIFTEVLVSTDSEAYADIARPYGAWVPFLRPERLAGSNSPDFEWVEYTIERLREMGRTFDCFSILRPTSPFRRAATIRKAWESFRSEAAVDSLRAVEPCVQHPAKMWVVHDRRMEPLLQGTVGGQPWHSSPYQNLPRVFVQNASLEIAWTRVISEQHSIAGENIMPFVSEGLDGFDINVAEDLDMAEILVRRGHALPFVPQPRQVTRDHE